MKQSLVKKYLDAHYKCPFLRDILTAKTKEAAEKAIASYKSVKGDSVYANMIKRGKRLTKCELWKAVNVNDTNEAHEFPELTYDDAKHWVINHLDCSKTWTIYNVSEPE